MQMTIDEIPNGIFDIYDGNGSAVARLEFGAYFSMDAAVRRFVPTNGKVEGDLLRGLILEGTAGRFVSSDNQIFLVTEIGQFEIRRFP
ncbi:hypothetical protein V2K41_18385 [Pseudomonas alliivorans]|uniref:hypothetical protein n=1 Tax=Pseudomonas fragariae (ex Marin et al. 2024) TaxID=3080056 RepID=UPI002ED1EB56|nr:hypothetical protein [Pseudomonas alliivorans]